MNRGFMIMALFAAISIAMYHYLQPQEPAMTDGETIDIIIQNRHMEPPIVRADEEANIKLEIRTDEPGTVRVDNYNISVTTAIGRAVEMSIPASRAGSFPILMYPLSAPKQGIRIGTLEVQKSRKGW
jgi:hypothetical protein